MAIEDDEEFGRRVRAARGYAGMSQPELARIIGVDRGKLGRVENAKTSLGEFEREEWVGRITRAAGLPQAFFRADLSRLPELEPAQPGRPLRQAEEILEDLRQILLAEEVEEIVRTAAAPRREGPAQSSEVAGDQTDQTSPPAQQQG